MPKKLTAVCLVLLIVALTLIACTAYTESYVFGTFYSVKIQGRGSNAIKKEIDNLFIDMESVLSTAIAGSDLHAINKADKDTPITTHPYTMAMFDEWQTMSKVTTAFNPAIFPLVELWEFSPLTFTGMTKTIPTQTEINTLLPLCSLGNFYIDKEHNTITKKVAGAKLDFGAIAKGYAVDLAYSVAKDTKCTINVGGTIRTNQRLNIAIASPRDKGYYASVYIDNESIATSGDYERYYMIDGTRYHHIIDKNGYPSGIGLSNPIISVTVIGERATICDALSTALMIDGASLAPYVESLGYSALLIYPDSYYIIGDKEFEIY